MDLLHACWDVLLELAPWLLIGTGVAGLLHIALPKGFVQRQLRGRLGVLRAVLVGVPLPLCSCGVIPAGIGLKKDGASDGASIGFLIATPQTGVDSIMVSAAFLGWPFALFKLASAFVTGVAGGAAVEAFGGPPVSADAADGPTPTEDTDEPRGLLAALHHGDDILRTIWFWLVVGVVISAAITTYLPPDGIPGVESLHPAITLFAVLLLSVPLYVCATASVPIAAALVAGGVSAGAALVFLVAGPATNIATIGAVRRAFGGRVLALYLVTIIGGSVLCGLLFDAVIATGSAAAHAHHHHHGAGWWLRVAQASAVVLLLLIARYLWSDLRHWLPTSAPAKGEQELTVGVEGMNCGSCVAKLERALSAADGVSEARVQLEPGQATVHGTIDEAQLRELVRAAGYRA